MLPENISALPVVVAAAVLLDRIVGDPQDAPHPVRWVGWLADRAEEFFRPETGSGEVARKCRSLICRGCIAWLAVVGLSTLVAAALLRLPWLGGVLLFYLAYAGLAMGSLVRECGRVARLLDGGRMEAARDRLSMLVSRDVSGLDEQGLRMTLGETLSENLNDGFVAPLACLSLGGVELLWAYKAASTLDSMWGYTNERYLCFGRMSARADDVLAYVPARLTAVLLVLAAMCQGMVRPGEMIRLLRRIRKDAAATASPNAGWAMAAAAWCMGMPLGGPAVYGGVRKEKPVLGGFDLPGAVVWRKEDTAGLLALVSLAGWLATAFFVVAAWIVHGL